MALGNNNSMEGRFIPGNFIIGVFVPGVFKLAVIGGASGLEPFGGDLACLRGL